MIYMIYIDIWYHHFPSLVIIPEPWPLTTKTPRPGPRCPGPRLSLATARFLQPAGHGCYDDFFGAPTSGASLCPQKLTWCPKSCSCVFFLFFFRVGFLGWCPFHKVLGENNQQEESVKIIPANCSCSLGVFILMSQDEIGTCLNLGLRGFYSPKRHFAGHRLGDGHNRLEFAGTIHQQTTHSEGKWPCPTSCLIMLGWLRPSWSHYHCNCCGIRPNPNRVRA